MPVSECEGQRQTQKQDGAPGGHQDSVVELVSVAEEAIKGVSKEIEDNVVVEDEAKDSVAVEVIIQEVAKDVMVGVKVNAKDSVAKCVVKDVDKEGGVIESIEWRRAWPRRH